MNRQIIRWISLGLLVLLMTTAAACSSNNVEEKVVGTLTAIASLQPASTNTAIPQPTTAPPTAEPTLTPIPSPTIAEPATLPPAEQLAPSAQPTAEPATVAAPAQTCLRLVEPVNGASLPSMSKQTFQWEPLPEAASYRLEITPPPWHFKQTFLSVQPSLYRWLNTMPWGGEYSWQVSALDARGEVICTSGAFKFTKAEFIPTATLRAEPGLLPTQFTEAVEE